MSVGSERFFAPQAWVQGGWQANVLLGVDGNGLWQNIQAGASPADCEGARHLHGAVLPGVVNAHSHAFQRAIAGLTERRSTAPGQLSDDFWSWRDRMYSAANRLSPGQLESIACMLYSELLAGGYTQVCEFHYLHNEVSGTPYADAAELSMALVRAAVRTGMGLTLLPTLYMRSGFNATSLREDQRRFASTPESILRIAEGVAAFTAANPSSHGLINAGVAIHSLRAVGLEAMMELTSEAKRRGLPVHIHISEQTQEVDDCIARTGQRPIEWLVNQGCVDSSWNLVHATHTTTAELAALKSTGASIVICPATEANLGDGVFDLPGWSALKGSWSIGSDSHVTRSWPEELRLLEYSQRLMHRQRNIAARVLDHESSAAGMLESALAGGSVASGLAQGGLAVGQRADFAMLDMQSPALLGMPAANLLDALVFSSPTAVFKDVFVAGRPVAGPAQFAGGFAKTMRELWSQA